MVRRLPSWLPGVAGALVAAALAALVAWSFWQRWQLLNVSPFPLGVDGYFYPIQLRGLLEDGALPYPSSPLAFYLIAPLAAATDPITGAKLAAALYGAAIAVPAYAVGARLGGGRGAGLFASALMTTSVGSAYLTIEFVKNGVGLTIALTALWLVLRAAEQPTRRWRIAALGGLAAAYATHKMAAALVLIVGAPVVLAGLAARGRMRGHRLPYAVAAVALAIAALAVPLAFPHRFLSPQDLALLGGLFSTTPRWTAPALVVPGGQLGLGHDALLGAVMATAAIVARVVRAQTAASRPEEVPHPPTVVAAAAWPILVLAIAIGLPWLDVTDRQGLGFRLRIAAFVPAALSAVLLARALLVRFARRDVLLAALAVVVATLRQPGERIEGMVVTHPALVTAAQALRGHVPPGTTLIVPERHIAFLVAWYTGAPVALRPEAIPPARRLRLLPLHFIGAGSPLDQLLLAARAEPGLPPPLGLHPRHPNGLVLVAEPTWRWLLERLPPADRARYAAWPTI